MSFILHQCCTRQYNKNIALLEVLGQTMFAGSDSWEATCNKYVANGSQVLRMRPGQINRGPPSQGVYALTAGR